MLLEYGGLILVGVVLYVFLGRRLQKIFISEKEAERLISEEEVSRLEALDRIKAPQINKFSPLGMTSSKISKDVSSQTLLKKLSIALLIIIIAGFLYNQFLMWKMGSTGILNKLFSISINITKK